MLSIFIKMSNSPLDNTCRIKFNAAMCPTLPPTVQQCPDPGEVVNGARSVRPEAGFAVGTVVRFSCNQGYQLEGPSQISCHGRDTGTPKWSDRSPKCVRKWLLRTPLFTMHAVTLTSNT